MYQFLREIAEYALNPYWQIFVLLISLLVTILFARRRLQIIFASFIVFYFVLISNSPLVMALTDYLQNQYSAPVVLSKKDAAVVLNGGTVLFDRHRNQFVYTGTSGRIFEAIRLYKMGWVKYLVIDGATPYPHGDLDDEATSMKRAAIEAGVPESKILIEPDSLTTFENGKNVVGLFKTNAIRDFYLVTSATHMFRAMKVFEKLGLQPIAYPVEFEEEHSGFSMSMGNMARFSRDLHEYFGLLAYRFTGKM